MARFWQQEHDEIIIEVDLFDCVGDDTTLRAEAQAEKAFLGNGLALDACVWFYQSLASDRIRSRWI